MMQFIHKIATVVLLLSLVNAGVLTKVLPGMKFRRSLNSILYDHAELPYQADQGDSYTNGDLLETLLDQPSKRQWCRKGMIYNHMLGSCTLSLSIGGDMTMEKFWKLHWQMNRKERPTSVCTLYREDVQRLTTDKEKKSAYLERDVAQNRLCGLEALRGRSKWQ